MLKHFLVLLHQAVYLVDMVVHHHLHRWDMDSNRQVYLVLLHHLEEAFVSLHSSTSNRFKIILSMNTHFHLALEVVEDKDLVVDVELVVLDEAGGSGVGPLDLPHVLPQLAPEHQQGCNSYIFLLKSDTTTRKYFQMFWYCMITE